MIVALVLAAIQSPVSKPIIQAPECERIIEQKKCEKELPLNGFFCLWVNKQCVTHDTQPILTAHGVVPRISKAEGH